MADFTSNVVRVLSELGLIKTNAAGSLEPEVALDTDENGNIIANVNHRTGTLAYLMSILGGEGELAVATDVQALVRYGAGGVPFILGQGGAVDFYQCSGDATTVPGNSTITTMLIDYVAQGNPADFDFANGTINPVNRVVNLRFNSSYTPACYVVFPSPVTTLGTFRNVMVQVNNGSSWQTVGQSRVAPAPLGISTHVVVPGHPFIFYNSLGVSQTRVRVSQDSTENLVCELKALTVESKIVPI